MEPIIITPFHAQYPQDLRGYYPADPPSLAAIGNLKILDHQLTAFFCSNSCPADKIIRMLDLANDWQKSGQVIISGFHSAIECEVLNVLLRGLQPIVLAPARSLERMRLPWIYHGPLSEGRLLIIAPFEKNLPRPSAEHAHQRNRFVAALADRIFVAHSSPGGKTADLMDEIASWGKPVRQLDAD